MGKRKQLNKPYISFMFFHEKKKEQEIKASLFEMRLSIEQFFFFIIVRRSNWRERRKRSEQHNR